MKSLFTIAICTALALSFAVPVGGDAPYEAYAAKTVKTSAKSPKAKANAKLPAGRYVIRSAVSNTRVVTVRGGSKKNGANVYLYTGDMAKNQLFDISYDSKGRALIKNVKSKKYVSVAKSKAKNGINVVQSSKGSSNQRRWVIEPAGSNHGQPLFRVRSALPGKYCLQLAGGKDRNAANIRVWKKNASSSEKFAFINVKSLAAPAEAPAIEDGIYRIGNSLSSSLRFSIPDDSAKNGVAPALSKNNNYALSQLFIFTYEKGYYRIRSLVSGKSLTVDAGNVLAKARVSQRTDSSKAYQRFRITNGPGGTYQITAKAGGLALRVAAGAAASGQTIETYYPSSAKSQRFTLTPISNINLKSDMYTISPRAKDDVNLSIESSSRSDGAGASFAKGSRSFAQKFRITKKSGGSYSIENVNSQLLLTASGSDVIQTKAQKGGPTDDQLWYSDLTLGGMRFISKSTGMAMQLTGSSGNYGIKLAASSGSTKQGFVPTETELFDKGQYRIDSRSGSGSLEVEDASFFDLASVMTGEADGSGTQAWFIRENSDGTVTIRNERSGKPLEVEDSSVESGVMQNTSSGGSEQKWLLEESDKGWYTLSSAYADTYMEVDETADTNDVNVRTTDAAVGNVPNSMEWRFVPTKLKEAGPAMPKEAADAVYDEAKKHLGKKYVFGASGPKTFDCSGYIYYVMNHSGVKEMSRVTAQDIYDSCVKISKASAKRGDLIFFKNTYKTNRIVTHLGIYLGGGKMIHAGSPVQISKVNTKYFNAHFYAYGRMA